MSLDVSGKFTFPLGTRVYVSYLLYDILLVLWARSVASIVDERKGAFGCVCLGYQKIPH